MPDKNVIDIPEEGDLSWMFNQQEVETAENIEETIIHKRTPHRKNYAALKQEVVKDFLTGIPGPGETWHIVSNGKYDFWTFVPVILDHLRESAQEFYGSTWTMNRGNVLDLLDLFDRGRIEKIAILTGTYFKRRETAVYATLTEGLLSRKQRYVAFQNHAKVILIRTEKDAIVIEGSANFTANPRLEQYTLTNDKGLYEFHKGWMEEMLTR
ncbi:MAG: phospholipase D family protein [Candidatus Ratteibacteria bacterium]|jgi:hypothetical protein